MASYMFSPSSTPPDKGFVKICGVSSIEDAQLCARYGADAIGMILTEPGQSRAPGSDRLTPDEAADLVAALRGRVHTVLLVHASKPDDIVALARHIEPSALQVQSNLPFYDLLEVKKQCSQIRIIKTFRVSQGLHIDELEATIRSYVDHGAIDAVLLDSERGGSGVVHDWNMSREIVARFAGTPVLLAGGLNKDNVAQARQRVGPYGVDVMTGVTSPSRRDRKDESRLREFFKAWNGALQVQTDE